MATPILLVDSATGSDSAASGAGPATAVTGTKGRTRNTASQLHVGFFEASAPDLSGVLTDGSHVLYIAISTAGQRNFSSIAGVKDTQHTTTGNITSGAAILSALGSTTGWSVGDVIKVAGAGAASADLYSTILTVDSSSQVTLNDNAGTSVTGGAVTNPKQVTLTSSQGVNTGTTDTSWAIGGKRATAIKASGNSSKLWENNSSTGDAKAGWIVEMASGHTETGISGPFNVRSSGDSTTGQVTLRGASAAATRPVITFSNNGVGLDIRGGPLLLKDFALENSNATKTASIAIRLVSGSATWTTLQNIKIAHSTNKFWKGVQNTFGDGSTSVLMRECEIGYTASFGYEHVTQGGTTASGQKLLFNFIHDTGGNAVTFGSDYFQGLFIHGNVIYNCTGIGINIDSSRAASDGTVTVTHNTIDSCTSDGIKVPTAAAWVAASIFMNNLVSNCGGYGFNFSSATFTAAYRDSFGLTVDGNNCYNNTSGAYNPSSFGSNDPGLNPTYANASGGDFAVTNTSLKAKGVPIGGTTHIGTGSSTYSYVDPGAAQRQESGGGLMVSPGMDGGLNG